MTKRITSYNDLLEEKERLKALLQAQKELIREDVSEIKEELRPVREAAGVIGKFISRDNSNPLLTMGTNTAVDLLVRKLILSRAGWFGKLIIPFLVKNYASHFVTDNIGTIKDKLFSLFSKKHKQNGKHEPVKE
jgi:hypothetical protein